MTWYLPFALLLNPPPSPHPIFLENNNSLIVLIDKGVYIYIFFYHLLIGSPKDKTNITIIINNNKNNTHNQVWSNCYVIHNNAYIIVSITIVLLLLCEEFCPEIPVSLSMSFSIIHCQESFLSWHIYTNGLFPVMPYTHCMYVHES